MAVYSATVWAIDLGNDSLKALHLRATGEAVEVIGFDNIGYGKVLSGSGISDMERDELIALSLRRFAREHNVGSENVIVSVSSHESFARFVTLPPVEQKKIPQVVKLEAGMQIPFDMSEVQWDWQLMSEPGSGEASVGIFAIKNDVVTHHLEYFGGEDIRVAAVQMAPMALYNYVVYDRPELVQSDDKAVVVLNIGAENTDLVVCTKSSVWQRCVPMGGNAFTNAIAQTFRLNFTKAEKLKRTAAMSKYARQVFQAMRPVFTDFVAEIQRSLGFYTNSNPDTKLRNIVALGGGTKLRGLLKYLQQTLQVPVERPDSFKRLRMAAEVSAPKFHENVGDFGVVYGLAVQGLGLGKIESNLLPRAVARTMTWASKAKYFTIAASVLLLVSVLALGRTILDRATYAGQADVRSRIERIISAAETARNKLRSQQNRASESKAIIDKAFEPFKYRDVLPSVYETILSVLPRAQNNPEQADLYKAFAEGDVKKIKEIPRKERKQIFITSAMVYFVRDLESAALGQTDMSGRRGVRGRRSTSRSEDFPMMPGWEEDFESDREYGRPRSRQPESSVGQPGFVVTLTGYSPYKSMLELMDPAGVETDRSKWGVVTRLQYLDQMVEPNSPFELYKKTESTHFELKYDAVSLEGQMPPGIGVQQALEGVTGPQGQLVLVDPMTKEPISRVSVLDEHGHQKRDKKSGRFVYEDNDHWFVLKFKLLWREGPFDGEQQQRK